MQDQAKSLNKRILARNAALRKLDRLTAGVAVSAFVGVGLLGLVGAMNLPGASTSVAGTTTCTSPNSAPGATSSDDATTDDEHVASTSIQTPSCTATSSTAPAVAVSGGSHPVK
jgi:hypothetical protein